MRDYLSALNMRSDWFFLVLVTFWQIIHCSLQTKTNKKCVLWQRMRETARCRCKIRHVSKFTAASRGSPCDSTALVIQRFQTFLKIFVTVFILNSTFSHDLW